MDGSRIEVDRSASIDARIALIADRQRARLSRVQLLHAGISPAAVQRRLARGRLVRDHPGVYSLPHTDDVPLGAEVAALRAGGHGSALSHHSSTTLWRLRPGTARPVHIVVPGHGGARPLQGVVIHHSVILLPRDIRRLHGLPVTAPARMLLDIAATLPEADMERLCQEALYRLKIVTGAQIQDVLARAGGHPGRRCLARVMGATDHAALTDSPVEDAMLELIRRARLPEPRTQVPLLDFKADFFWPELKLVVETDARSSHGGPGRFESDRHRDARLSAELGIVVLRFTRLAIESRPFEVIATLARVIGRLEERRGTPGADRAT